MVQHFTVPQKTVMNACFHSDNLLPTGNGRLVQALLAAGADPCIKDLRGKSAYDCSQNQQIRNIFRRFAGRNPSKWPYSKANIVPLTKEMENRRALKRKKKKKRARLQGKQKSAEVWCLEQALITLSRPGSCR